MMRRSSFSKPSASPKNRRSSFVANIDKADALKLNILQARVAAANEAKSVLSEAASAPLDPTVLELLNTPPEERESGQVDGIVKVLETYAPQFTASCSDEQLAEVAKVCLHHHFEQGSEVCAADENTS